jgi:ophiobolin F synthase
MVEFSMAIKISDKDREAMRSILDVVAECMCVSQDYWSFDKEYDEWVTLGTPIFNAVQLFIQKEDMTIDEAKEKVKSRALQLEREYCHHKAVFYGDRPEETVHLKHFIETLGVIIGSYNYWATQSPRYHSWMQLSSRESRGPSGENNDCVTSSTEDLGTTWTTVSPPEQPSSNTCPSENQMLEQINCSSISSKKQGKQHEKDENNEENDAQPRDSFQGDPIFDLAWRKPTDTAIKAPCNYISYMPSKGVRSTLIEAFNHWLHVPDSTVALIESLIRTLHNASIILDDIQDNSPLRRGKPAAHTIFGPSQAMNSGLFMFVEAVQSARRLPNPSSVDIVLQNLEYLYLGQSLDLHWKFNLRCPSIADYINMVDNKTGGMFRMLASLLRAESPLMSNEACDFESLVLLLGRFFQIRDDYMNLQCTEYGDQKGFCEDLDEGKFSYPIVHLLAHKPVYEAQIMGIFRQRPFGFEKADGLAVEAKMHLLGILKEEGALDATLDLLKRLEGEVECEIEKLERGMGERNPLMRLLIARLSVRDL